MGQFLGLGITNDGYLFLLLAVVLQELKAETSEYMLVGLSSIPGVRSRSSDSLSDTSYRSLKSRDRSRD